MTKASESLYYFVRGCVNGICEEEDKISIEIVESTPKLITVIVKVSDMDVKFVRARIREIKLIGISIAQRHKVVATIALEEGSEEEEGCLN